MKNRNMVNGMRVGSFVIAKNGVIRYVTMDNGNGKTFTDDGVISGQEASNSCRYVHYQLLDRRVIFSERFRLLKLLTTGEVLPYYFELPFNGWLTLLK